MTAQHLSRGDWARALLALNATQIDEELVRDTLNVILKYEGDIRKAQSELGRLIVRKAEAPKPAAAPAATPAAGVATPATPGAAPAAQPVGPAAPAPPKKGTLH